MPLHSRDVQKLLKAGFTIIREDAERKSVKCKTLHQPEWHTLQNGFKTKAEMRFTMNELLKGSKTIED